MALSTTAYTTDSVGLFKPFWILWRTMGVNAFGKIWISRVYDILLNVLITIWYPVHLTVGLFVLPMEYEIFKTISISITCMVCSLKHYCLRWHLKRLHQVEDYFRQLDARVQNREEYTYFTQGPKRRAENMAKMYFYAYMAANLMATVGVLLDSERRLMYPAWFPFDWSSSSVLYWTALTYQFVGITVQIVQNMINDIPPPVILCLMAGHVRLLSMRVSRIGYDPDKTVADNESELKKCIDDHVKLLRLFHIVEEALSLAQLVLFISSGLNICVVMIYLIFYVDSLMSSVYYVLFTIALVVELFPCYYYGSLLQHELGGLPYAIFCSNWTEQPKRYRRNVIIFAEVTLRKLTMLGGGIVGIRLESFFAICKMAYSLFAVVIRIK